MCVPGDRKTPDMARHLPPAEELRLLDRELHHLDARRTQLLARREWLVKALAAAGHRDIPPYPGKTDIPPYPGETSAPSARHRAPGPQEPGPQPPYPHGPQRPHVPPPAPGPHAPPPAPGPYAPPPGPRAGEASKLSVQNLLLALGGVLLTVAAIAFTLVSWGRMGIAGRSVVLAVVTLATLATPLALLRRGLRSTAEAVGAVGLALLFLDAYALRQVALPDTGAAGYWAVATAVIAGVWTGYGLLSRVTAPAATRDRPAPPGPVPGAAGPGPHPSPGSSSAPGPHAAAEPAVRPVPTSRRRGLRLPFPLAVLVGQLPLPLWAAAAVMESRGLTAMLLTLATLDILLLLALRRTTVAPAAAPPPSGAAAAVTTAGAPAPVPTPPPTSPRVPLPAAGVLAAVGAAVSGGYALALALALSVTASTVGAAAVAGVLLLWGAALCLAVVWRPSVSPQASVTATAVGVVTSWVAGLAAVAAFGGVVIAGRPERWNVVISLLCALALAAATRLAPLRAPARTPIRRGVLLAAGTVQVAALARASGAVGVALLIPLARIGEAWAGVPSGAAMFGPADVVAWAARPAVPASLAITTMALAVTGRMARRIGTTAPGTSRGDGLTRAGGAAVCGAVATAAAAAVTLPYALTSALPALAPYPAVVGWLLATVGGLIAASFPLRRRALGAAARTALGCALLVAVPAIGLGLAAEAATYVVLGSLLVLTTAAIPVGIRSGDCDRPQRATLAVAAVLCAAGLAVAAPMSLDWPPRYVALAVLLVPAAAAALAALPRIRAHALVVPLECAGGVTASAAVGLALGVEDLPMLSLVLGLTGVILAATALRADRRPGAAYLATGLFVLATWVRLAASDVDVPEAYALPVTIPALVVGYLRRRSVPETSSWLAYGPGLLATLVPSVVALWTDEQWTRPLLLGVAALAVTLAGARARLQAPLVLGGSVVAVTAVHELAPYVVQVVNAVPRWMPPALVGLVLLGLGATYEKRLRDARRIRDALGRMR